MSASNHSNTNHLTRTLRVSELCEAIAAGEIRPRQRDGCYYISGREIERVAEARRGHDADLDPDVYDFHDLPDMPDMPDLHVSSLA
jgi:hypothetical protein